MRSRTCGSGTICDEPPPRSGPHLGRGNNSRLSRDRDNRRSEGQHPTIFRRTYARPAVADYNSGCLSPAASARAATQPHSAIRRRLARHGAHAGCGTKNGKFGAQFKRRARSVVNRRWQLRNDPPICSATSEARKRPCRGGCSRMRFASRVYAVPATRTRTPRSAGPSCTAAWRAGMGGRLWNRPMKCPPGPRRNGWSLGGCLGTRRPPRPGGGTARDWSGDAKAANAHHGQRARPSTAARCAGERFAVVRLGHRDLPVRSVGAWRRSATGQAVPR